MGARFDISELRKELARKKYLEYMKYCWMKPQEPLVEGLHTREIGARLDRALEDFRKGKSTYLRIKVHQRAGKSDLVSRFLPPRFMAEFPDCESMNITYSAGLAEKFAMDSFRLMKSEKFLELFPDVRLDREKVSQWTVKTWEEDRKEYRQRAGQSLAKGLGGGMTGNGYHLGILDDFCASRKDAESSGQRQTMWEAFTNDFMTRMAPVHIVVILATQWHEDDIHGRIANKNNKKHEDYDPDFPVFEEMSFPARKEVAPPELADKYPGDYLFMERYGESWYKGQYAILGTYASAAMMDCDPVPRGGGILHVDGVVYHNSVEDFPKIPYYRVWDYAHTAKERTGDDPDYTGGTLIGFEPGARNPATRQIMWSIWILDYVQFRENATERDREIYKIAVKDGGNVKILVECSLDSRDGFIYLKNQLGGIRTVAPAYPPGDKVQRCTPVEPVFEAGNVHVLRGPWNRMWKDGLARFDGTGKTHDEMVDNITAGFHHIALRNGHTGTGKKPGGVGRM